MAKHPIAVSADGKQVYAYLFQSAVAAQIARQPHLVTLIKEIASQLTLTAPQVTIEQDMGRPIGYSEVLETREKDVIFYAKLNKNDGYTRFVKNRRTDPTSFLSVIFVRDDEGEYELKNVYLGKIFPPFPNEEDINEQSKAYWEDHAVVYNGQPILASTQTKTWPY